MKLRYNGVLKWLMIVLFLWSASVSANDLLSSSIKISVKRFEILGNNPLPSKTSQEILASYLGDHYGLEGIEAAASALDLALKKAGYRLFKVSIPAQKLNTGVIELEIINVSLNELNITGNRYFSNENILRSLPSLGMQNTDNIARELILANRNRSKNVALSLENESLQDQLSATLEVKDRKQKELILSLDNTGSEATGDYRLGLKFAHNNLFDKDHGLMFSYKISPTQKEDIDQYGLNYRLPLYRIGTEVNLTAWNSESNIAGGEGGNSFKGAGKIYGMRFSHFLAKNQKKYHQWDLSLQDRLFLNNNTQDNETATDVRSRPLELLYKGEMSSSNFDMYAKAGYRKNLSGGSKNHNRAYQASRKGAKQNWEATFYDMGLDYFFESNWRFNASIEGQLSNDTLISGEQFGFGGSYSLLGFQEWEILGDEGHQLKLELMTPKFANDAYLFGSYGAGTVKRNTVDVHESQSERASSLGFGLVSAVGDSCDLKLQLGYVLDGVDDLSAGEDRTRDGDSRIHFNFLCNLL